MPKQRGVIVSKHLADQLLLERARADRLTGIDELLLCHRLQRGVIHRERAAQINDRRGDLIADEDVRLISQLRANAP